MEINRTSDILRTHAYNNNKFPQNNSGNFLSSYNSKIISNSLAEAIGRSQVNFCANNSDINLDENDKSLISTMSKIFRVKEEVVPLIQKETAEFLKKYDKKSFSEFWDMFDSHASLIEMNEFAMRVGYRINLSNYEENVLRYMVQEYINAYDKSAYLANDYKFFKYTADHNPYLVVMKKNEVLDEDGVGKAFSELCKVAGELDYESVFDLFSPKSLKSLKPRIDDIFLSNIEDCSEESVDDIILDMCNYRGKSREEILYDYTSLFRPIMRNTIVMAQALHKNFDIKMSPEFVYYLNEKFIDRDPQDIFRATMDLACELADKYNLPIGSAKTIMDIMKKIESSGWNDNNLALYNEGIIELGKSAASET
jgi:hypothetical protein